MEFMTGIIKFIAELWNNWSAILGILGVFGITLGVKQ